jgi:hypothetical protein
VTAIALFIPAYIVLRDAMTLQAIYWTMLLVYHPQIIIV